MSQYDAAPRPALTPGQLWRRLVEGVWKVEHAFERARAADRAVDDTRLRIFLVLCLFAFGFMFVGLEAGKKALFSGIEPDDLAPPPAALARADLVDRNGEILAVDLAHYGLYLDPREVWDAPETRAGLLRALPRLDPARLSKALAGHRREYLAGGLTPAERERVHDLGLPGVDFEEESRRAYPLGATAGHYIGFADAGGKGLAGAERALDAQVRAAGAGGGQVQLAMDLRVQAALEDEMRRGMATYGPKAVMGVVTDLKTGEILALSSLPDFDPNDPGKSDPAALTNHVAASDYEMGSTFKMFAFAEAVDSGRVGPNSTFDATTLQIGPRVIHDHHKVNRALTLREIFDYSSNVGTAKMALAAGGANMERYFNAFGLLSPVKVELAETARPIRPRTWDENTVASAAFGNAIAVTPLNVAAGVGAIMNGGTYVPLTLLKRDPGAPIAGTHRAVSPQTSRMMLDFMRDNVVDPIGSGKKADAPGLRVGGKTGSNEKADHGKIDRDKLLTSFAAVFPTDGPLDAHRYLVLIVMDEPHATKETYGFALGGWNAAPVAGKVVDRIAGFLHVARVPTTPFATPKPAAALPAAEEETTTSELR
ncbi:MAG: penicillin-binding protein 2 [Caulobacteraceae bacterium]|nr:penicillin-binding protein 2 [Caulobacter sp.]